ncbi:MAG: BrnA antitoxin family protein [Deltaproteobacteria bacterium]|nr:MAG: BrnA antitoxin family protein [Deltaproteobacteria bacterium]
MKKEYNFKNAKRGQVVPQKGKTRITIYLDADVIEEFRARADEAGYGYQTMINEALRQYLEKGEKPLNEEVIRQVIREELDRVTPH